MPVNPYFQNYPGQHRIDNESQLIEDLFVESIQIMGHNIYYIPRESFDEGDMIYGEYTKSKFSRAYLIESYITPSDHFDGQGDFFSKFGLEIKENSSFVVSKRSFTRFIPSSLRSRPQEGDLLYVPVMRRMFEVKFVEEERGHFMLGKRNPYIYELQCELFRYSQEPIDTGVEEVDEVGSDNSYVVKIVLNTNGTGLYLDDDIAYQSPDGLYANATSKGIIKEWYAANGSLFLYNITGDFVANSNVYATKSNAVYRMVSKDDKTDYVLYDVYDNMGFDTGANLILDLSEQNVFGTP